MKPLPGYDTFPRLISKIIKLVEDEGYSIDRHTETSVGDYLYLKDHKNLYYYRDAIFVDLDTEKIYCSGTAIHLQKKIDEVTND